MAITVKCKGTPAHELPLGTKFCPNCGSAVEDIDLATIAMMLAGGTPPGIPASPQVIAPQTGASTYDMAMVLAMLPRDEKFQAAVSKEVMHLLTRDTAVTALIEKLAMGKTAEAIAPLIKRIEALETRLATETKEREALANRMAEYSKVNDESIAALGTVKKEDDKSAAKKRSKFLTKEYWLGKTGSVA